MREVSTFIIRLYFAVIAAVTIFTLMFGAVDLLNMGLKTWIFPAADVPEYLENCSEFSTFRNADDSATEAEIIEDCEARNATTTENYFRTKAQDAVQNLALMLVALPLFLLHFRIVLRDWRKMNGIEKTKK